MIKEKQKKTKKQEPNEFEQLVENLKTGKLSLTMIQIAVRASVQERNDIPEGIKDLRAGHEPEYSGIIYTMFKPIQEVIGAMELAYRRGSDK